MRYSVITLLAGPIVVVENDKIINYYVRLSNLFRKIITAKMNRKRDRVVYEQISPDC